MCVRVCVCKGGSGGPRLVCEARGRRVLPDRGVGESGALTLRVLTPPGPLATPRPALPHPERRLQTALPPSAQACPLLSAAAGRLTCAVGGDKEEGGEAAHSHLVGGDVVGGGVHLGNHQGIVALGCVGCVCVCVVGKWVGGWGCVVSSGEGLRGCCPGLSSGPGSHHRPLQARFSLLQRDCRAAGCL